ncbi:MAG: leucine-rich repeat protein [Clostridiales bacterium]|nr:leucine-rich repeat protein [Clostridiales bacterium]
MKKFKGIISVVTAAMLVITSFSVGFAAFGADRSESVVLSAISGEQRNAAADRSETDSRSGSKSAFEFDVLETVYDVPSGGTLSTSVEIPYTTPFNSYLSVTDFRFYFSDENDYVVSSSVKLVDHTLSFTLKDIRESGVDYRTSFTLVFTPLGLVSSSVMRSGFCSIDGYYEIYTPEDLRTIASNYNTYKTADWLLCNDIDMTPLEGQPRSLGFMALSNANAYKGTFTGKLDENGKKPRIMNLVLPNATNGSSSCPAMFRYVCGATFSNIEFYNCSLTGTSGGNNGIIAAYVDPNVSGATAKSTFTNLSFVDCSVSTNKLYAGLIGGYLWGNYTGSTVPYDISHITVENCSVTCSANANYVGGLFGAVYTGNRKGVAFNDIDVSGLTVSSSGNYVGGLIGAGLGQYADVYSFTNISVVDSSVSGASYVGGLIGHVGMKSVNTVVTINNVEMIRTEGSAFGGVSATSSYVGGLIGEIGDWTSDAAVANVSITADISDVTVRGASIGGDGTYPFTVSSGSSGTYAGGLIGAVYGKSSGNYSPFVNVNITNTDIDYTRVTSGATCVGGLVGGVARLNNMCDFVFNVGNTTGDRNVTIDNSEVSGSKYVGGVVGRFAEESAASTVSNTASSVKAAYGQMAIRNVAVTGLDAVGTGCVGGIVGGSGGVEENSLIENCLVADSFITATSSTIDNSEAGGIAGIYCGTISSCTVNGTAESGAAIAGFMAGGVTARVSVTSGRGNLIIDGCNVLGNTEIFSLSDASATRGGGMIASVRNTSVTINNCGIGKGVTVRNVGYGGGICGSVMKDTGMSYDPSFTAADCVSYADITATSVSSGAGGILGYNDAPMSVVHLNGCVTGGSVRGYSRAGGIIGFYNSATPYTDGDAPLIENCIVVSSVKSTGTNGVSGLIIGDIASEDLFIGTAALNAVSGVIVSSHVTGVFPDVSAEAFGNAAVDSDAYAKETYTDVCKAITGTYTVKDENVPSGQHELTTVAVDGNSGGSGALITIAPHSYIGTDGASRLVFNDITDGENGIYGGWHSSHTGLMIETVDGAYGYSPVSISVQSNIASGGVEGVYYASVMSTSSTDDYYMIPGTSEKVEVPVDIPVSVVNMSGFTPDGGSGTASDPYRIATKDQLESIRYIGSTKDKYFLLTADLTYSEPDYNNMAEKFIPIGYTDSDELMFTFEGTFDFGTHSISGLAITPNINKQYVGFFAKANGATFKADASAEHPALSDVLIKTSNRNAYAGALVGYAEDTVFINIDVDSVTTVDPDSPNDSGCSSLYLGAVAGYVKDPTLTDSDISNSSLTGAANVGGIFGHSHKSASTGEGGTISNVTVRNLTARAGAGDFGNTYGTAAGVVGEFSGSVTNAVVDGGSDTDVYSVINGSAAGGIVASQYYVNSETSPDVTITNSVVTGNCSITSERQDVADNGEAAAGGIMGITFGVSNDPRHILISGCVVDETVTVGSRHYSGGILGAQSNLLGGSGKSVVIENCTVKATVSASDLGRLEGDAGGVVGYVFTPKLVSINNVLSACNCCGAKASGGIAGEVYSPSGADIGTPWGGALPFITNCTVAGKVGKAENSLSASFYRGVAIGNTGVNTFVTDGSNENVLIFDNIYYSSYQQGGEIGLTGDSAVNGCMTPDYSATLYDVQGMIYYSEDGGTTENEEITVSEDVYSLEKSNIYFRPVKGVLPTNATGESAASFFGFYLPNSTDYILDDVFIKDNNGENLDLMTCEKLNDSILMTYLDDGTGKLVFRYENGMELAVGLTVRTSFALGACGENLKWRITLDEVLRITGTGEMSDFDDVSSPWYAYKNNIKAVSIGDSVGSIGSFAFSGCDKIAEIAIPDGVTSIGDYAFKNCTQISSVTIPDGVLEIGDSPFGGCAALSGIAVSSGNTRFTSSNGVLFNASLTKIIQYPAGKEGISYSVPSGVTVVGGGAFYGCGLLEAVTIPESVTEIGDKAFFGCTALTAAEVSGGAVNIGSEVFSGCTALSSVTLNEGITGIGESMFEGCIALSEITLPSTVGYIGEKAFKGCSALSGITIPGAVTSIGASAFEGCSSLVSVSLPDNLTVIENEVFKGCSSLSAISVPDGVTSIGASAFEGCAALSEITLPDGVTAIGNDAFKNCSGVTVVTIPLTLSSVGDGAFDGCEALTEVYYFGSDSDRAQMTIGDSNTYFMIALWHYRYYGMCGDGISWDLDFDGAFTLRVANDSDGVMTDYTMPSAVPWSQQAERITSLDIGSGVTNIGNYAFYGCTGLTEVTLPGGVERIGNRAFSYCSSLAKITVPESVNEIGSGAFASCSLIAEFTVPDGVSAIKAGAFSGCSLLSEITMPKSVTAVASDAFDGCTALNDVYYDGTPRSKGKIDFNSEQNIILGAVWHFAFDVPYTVTWTVEGTDTVETYYQSDVIEPPVVPVKEGYVFTAWDPEVPEVMETTDLSFTALFVPEIIGSGKCGASLTWTLDSEGLLKITGEGPMSYVDSPWAGSSMVKTLDIASGVTSIAKNAFKNCTEITEITINENIESIGSGAFAGCTGITEINVASGNEYFVCVDGVLFNTSMTKLIQYPAGKVLSTYAVPTSVTEIEPKAFLGCTGLTEVTILDGVTNIGESTFAGCSSLSSVTIPLGVTAVGKNAFAGCNLLGDVYYGGSVKTREKTDIGIGNDRLDTAVWHYAVEYIFAEEITVTSSKTTANVGETVALSATVLPVNASSKELVWTSSDPLTASVSSDGKVTCKRAGMVRITVTNAENDCSSEIYIQVFPSEASVFIRSYDGGFVKKVSWWKPYSSAEMSLYAMTYKCDNAARCEWSSSTLRVNVDQNGKITNTGCFSRSAVITFTVYDDEDNVIASDSVTVSFYKFNWQKNRLDVQSVVSDNVFMRDMPESELEAVSQKPDSIIVNLIGYVFDFFGRIFLR